MSDLIYKICPKGDWDAARKSGVYSGSADDQRDGFIHFSLKHQVRATLDKHFSGRDGLLLLAVATDRLNPEALKYEISRKGEKFPHLYGNLFPSAVVARYTIALSDAGGHIIDCREDF